jgi:hypothetical protein
MPSSGGSESSHEQPAQTSMAAIVIAAAPKNHQVAFMVPPLSAQKLTVLCA